MTALDILTVLLAFMWVVVGVFVFVVVVGAYLGGVLKLDGRGLRGVVQRVQRHPVTFGFLLGFCIVLVMVTFCAQMACWTLGLREVP